MADGAPARHPLVLQLLTKCRFPPATTEVTCAVSGGADSSALLILATAAGCHPTAVHVDHQLRPGADSEAEIVRDLAGRLGVPFRAVRVEVGEGPNLEARARDARYRALPPDVLTGHTADDQAETMLSNLLRGAGRTGLAAMRPGPRRPLLAIRRADTALLCRELDIEVVRDPSNLDPRHQRNRIRHELLPLLADIANRDPVPVLVRQTDLLRDEADLLDELAAQIDPTDARDLAAAPVALARRAVRRWLTAAHPPDAATVERVLAVARGDAAAADVGDGRRVDRHRQRLRLHPWATSGTSE